MVLKIDQRKLSIAGVMYGDFDGKQAMSVAVHWVDEKHDPT